MDRVLANQKWLCYEAFKFPVLWVEEWAQRSKFSLTLFLKVSTIHSTSKHLMINNTSFSANNRNEFSLGPLGSWWGTRCLLLTDPPYPHARGPECNPHTSGCLSHCDPQEQVPDFLFFPLESPPDHSKEDHVLLLASLEAETLGNHTDKESSIMFYKTETQCFKKSLIFLVETKLHGELCWS
jgi:hypothetical protein